MATTSSPSQKREAVPVLVSRQPVLSARDRVVGYRVAYSLLSDGKPVAPTAEQYPSLVTEVLAIIDKDERALGNLAHLSLSREILQTGSLPNVSPDQVLLRISYEDAIDVALQPVIEQAATDGFQLELDGLPAGESEMDLIDCFSAVEIDASGWDPGLAASAVSRIRRNGVLAVASGVRSYSEREHARALGFDWFTGPFFATPNMVSGEPIPVGDLHTIVDLYAAQRADASLEELVAMVEREVGLGIRLLRYINSAYFGYAGKVRSISQAATLLGTRGLSRWALIVAVLAGSNSIPPELSLTALTRARACELLGSDCDEDIDPDELFTVGMLSACDAIFRMPMGQLVEELPLADHVGAALSDHSGPLGAVVQSVILYEQGDFAAAASGAPLSSTASAYREALDWARHSLYGIG